MYYLISGALGAASGLGWYLATDQWQMPYLVFLAFCVASSLLAEVVERVVELRRACRDRPVGRLPARHRKGVAP